jgi:hypothetical protein
MQVELVQTTTSDGVRLHGAYLAPEGGPPASLGVDIVVMVHGSGGNFYATPSNPRAGRLRSMGVPVVLFNTRGHDVVAGHSGGKRVGNAYEVLDECRLDMAAAVDWCAERGFKRVCLLGSSLGAVKVVYAQAHNQDPRVAAVVSLSPLRLSHRYFLASELGEEHRRFWERSKALADAGEPDALVEVSFPISHHFSAAVYLDRHCTERYDLTAAHTDRVSTPLLILGGSTETHPRMRDAVRDMAALAKGQPRTRSLVVEGGDHGLQNRDEEFFAALMDFLTSL